MTKDEAIKAYSEKFGGFPDFLFMGAADSEVVSAVKKALKTGEEIDAPGDPGDLF